MRFLYVFILALLALLIEGLLFLMLSQDAASIQNILLWHVLLSCVLLIATGYEYRKNRNGDSDSLGGLISIIFLLSAVLGVFGACISFLISVVTFIFIRQERNNQWLYDAVKDSNGERRQANILELKEEGIIAAKNIVALQDVMTFGSLSEKRAAISLMANHYIPEFAKVLRVAVIDKENSVRVHAATVITDIDQTYLAKIMALENKLFGAEMILKDELDISIKLLQAYYDYAKSEICSKATQQVYYEKALKLYDKRVAKKEVKQSEALTTLVCEISISLHQWGRAEIESNYYLTHYAHEVSPRFFLLLCELYFYQHQYDKITALCQQYQNEYKQESADVMLANDYIKNWLESHE